MKITRVILKRLIITTVMVSSIQSIVAQNSEIIQIPWQEPSTIVYEGDEFLVPSIEGQFMDGDRPNFFYRKPFSGTVSVKPVLNVLETQPASVIEVNYLTSRNILVNQLEHYLTISSERGNRSVVLNLFPFVSVNGSIHKIKTVSITIEKDASLGGTAYQKDFATTSVLSEGSGVWCKIAVDQDGIYKIDKELLTSFLEPLGVDMETLNPQDINIYGNGDGRLPELNSVPRTDDLAKNAIEIVGETDGSFDDEDYILFYGWGADRMYANSTIDLYEDRNPYSDLSYYFINVSSGETPMRVQLEQNASGTPTNAVSSYSYFAKHELDAVSLVNGGQRWYGELFDSQSERTVSFNVPDIDQGTPASFTVFLASNANSGSGNTHSYSVNGLTIGSGSLPVASSDYARDGINLSYTTPSAIIPLKMTVSRNSPDILTYLDYIELNARRSLKLFGNQLNFRDLPSVGTGNISEFNVEALPLDGFVWDVTNRHAPRKVDGSFVGSNYQFQLATDSLREFVASNGTLFNTPELVGGVDFQNLHGLEQADYLIVSPSQFLAQANRLADLHRSEGLSVHVVTDEQVFNEFSSGMKDPTAIRTFAKMFYDRSISNPDTRPEYLLLFGDGTFDPKDRVPNNNNFIITYQAENSENHIRALVTDDYYGLLDDSESINPNDEMDIGVGRLLISSNEIARQQVDKIEHYMKNGSDLYSTANTNCSSDDGSSTFGDWRTRYVQIADDEEGGYFINVDSEPAYNDLLANTPEINVDKLYLDAFQQVATAGGSRYPDVFEAINDRMERGALVTNYIGHGGEVGVAEERVITVPQIQGWKNIDNMTLMVSATCEFTKYDDPDRVSAGEWASLNPFGGAIALMTTTRSVFFGVNTITIEKFIENVFSRDSEFKPMRFGEIMRLTKNSSGSSPNKRSFTLIGDPALRIALPEMKIITDSINGIAPSVALDTLQALSTVTIKGHIEDHIGNVLTGFNGEVSPTVFDKPKTQQTLGNDADSPVIDFEIQNNRVYRGKASVTNGYFEFTFVVPKDINYSYDFGKLSYYAHDNSMDAIGEDKRFYIGGIDPNGLNDSEGPQIDLFLNEDTFVDGGISDETPILIAKLFDENGINTVGNGIGHDIVAVLDGNTADPIVLNDYYTADLDSYQSGEVRFNFDALSPGSHSLSLKVWDVNNNSSEASINFIVQEKQEIVLDHVLNYPNPFTTSTEFFFEHNQACTNLDVQIQVFTIAGRLVKTINESIQCDGFRSKGIQWNGRDDFGDQLAKGTYVYRLKVRTPDNVVAEKIEKLVILK